MHNVQCVWVCLCVFLCLYVYFSGLDELDENVDCFFFPPTEDWLCVKMHSNVLNIEMVDTKCFFFNGVELNTFFCIFVVDSFDRFGFFLLSRKINRIFSLIKYSSRMSNFNMKIEQFLFAFFLFSLRTYNNFRNVFVFVCIYVCVCVCVMFVRVLEKANGNKLRGRC